MSGIEAVIARSRQPGGFSERKQFTVARNRGIQKLRRFALADPHHYILELIQSAIANGARHIEILLEQTRCTLSYIGGGLLEAELGQLFDFLFASKDRTDIGHVRELALGINAVLLFQPDRVVVESGDGTLRGTTRMVLHGDTDEVEVGRPERPLTGTYVHVEGMKRARLPGGRAVSDPPRERGVIEIRCLAAPIPIIVNHESLFGYSSQRMPGLFGYRKTLAIDEGDLYGTIGLEPRFGDPSFQLLTRGVAIATKEHPMLARQRIGGIICFDGLRKTVDHSGIVDDERLEEMWVRLRPYARQLHTGHVAASPYETALFGGEPLAAADLRRLLREHRRVVVVPPEVVPSSMEGHRVQAIGRALEVPVLSAPQAILPALRALSGGRVGIVTPSTSDHNVSFYEAEPVSPPARPWLASPVEVEPLPVARLTHRIDPQKSQLVQRLGVVGQAEAVVYTPQELCEPSDGLSVWITTTDRLVAQHVVPSAYPGHVLLVRLPDSDPATLLDPVDPQSHRSLSEDVAHAMAEHAVSALSTAFGAAVRSLGVRSIEPGTVAAGLGLAALTRSVVPRLRAPGGEPTVDLVQLEAGELDLLELPLLRTRAGRNVCMHDVMAMMNDCGGLLYGTIPSVPAAMDGLDPDRVLDLDESTERLLVSLFGEEPYVRIDRRDVLAEFRGVQCRDLALGLREYPDFPLLIEGADPSGWSPDERSTCEHALVTKLVDRMLGLDPPPPDPASERIDWEECRRQACRHLQWYVCRRARRQGGVHQDDAVLDALPLFLDPAGRAHGLRDVRAAIARSELVLIHGHALGSASLGALVDAVRHGDQEADEREPVETIVAGPWIHRLLAPLGPLRLAFDFDVPARRQDGVCDAFLVSVELESNSWRGRIGVPIEPGNARHGRLDVPVILPDNRQLSVFTDLAFELGVAGWVRLAPSTQWSHEHWAELAAGIRSAAHDALRRLLDRLPDVSDATERDRILEVLLDHAGRHLSIFVDPHGQPQVHPIGELVGRILSMPLFPSRFGGVLPGWRLVRRFCGLLQSGSPEPAREILAELRPPISRPAEAWIHRVLHASNVVHAPTHDVHVAPPVALTPGDHRALCTKLETWLARLRPDPVQSVTRIHTIVRDPSVFAEGALDAVSLNSEHWLVSWGLRAAATDPQVVAWLLLAVYAHINHVLDAVSNEHERTFQRRVLAASAANALAGSRNTPADPDSPFGL